MKTWMLVLAISLVGCKSEAKQSAPDVAKTVPTGATPEEAFKNYQQAIVKRDLEFFYSFVSDKDKADFAPKLAMMNGKNIPASRRAEFVAGFRATEAEIRKMSKLDFDKHFYGMLVDRGGLLQVEQRITKTTITGDTALLELEGPATKFAMRLEGGQWHWDLDGTSKANLVTHTQ